MGWLVQKWDAINNVWQPIDVSDIRISKSVDELYSASLVVPATTSLVRTDLLRITYDGTIVFEGYVTKVTNQIHSVTVRCIEKASELRKSIVDYGGTYVHTWTNITVDAAIDNILSGTSWTRGSTDTTIIPALHLEYVDRLSALSKVIKDIRGMYLWFENGKVYFGSSRTDRTTMTIEYSDREDDDDDMEYYDKIIVIGGGANQRLTAEVGTGSNVGIFEYPDAQTQDELDAIAQTLYNVYSTTRKRITLTTPLYVDINPGDLLSIDGQTYMVYEIEHTLTQSRITVGYYSPSMGRVLKQLQRVQRTMGRIAQGVVETYENSLSYLNVGASSPAKWKVDISDDILNAKLRIHLTKWKKTLQTQATTTGATINTGYSSIQKKGTGISVSSDYADIQLNTTGATVQSGNAQIQLNTTNATIQTGGITNTVSDYSRVTISSPLTYDNYWTFYGPSGYQFVICVATAQIKAASSDLIGVAYLYWWDSSIASWDNKCILNLHVPANQYDHITLVGVADGSSFNSVMWRVHIYSASGGTLEWLYVNVFFVNLHDHAFNEGAGHKHNDQGHDHSLDEGFGHKHNDQGHAHGLNDPQHDHSDLGHAHGLNEGQGHQHPETDDATDLALYPSNVYVYVNGQQVYGPITGGTETSTLIDLTSYLQQGENVIEVRSDTAGGVYGVLQMEKFVRR